MQLLFLCGISIILSLLYQQFSPRIGNIWLRPNSLGTISFNPSGVLLVIFMPFKHLFVWNPLYWDLNWVIWVILLSIINVFFYKQDN
jgi:hypothetical protein